MNDPNKEVDASADSIDAKAKKLLEKFLAKPFNAMDHLKEKYKAEIKVITDIRDIVHMFRVTQLDDYLGEFQKGDEDAQDTFKVLALNLGGVEASAFEERMFAEGGKVWNNGTFSLNPQKFEIKTIVGREGSYIDKVLDEINSGKKL